MSHKYAPSECVKKCHPTPVLLPGKSHGWRSLIVYSPWGRSELDTTERLHFHALGKEMAAHFRVLAWRIPGTGEPGGLPSVGSHKVGHDWSNLAAAAAEDHLFKRNGWIPEQMKKCVMFYLVLLQSPFIHFYWALKTISFSSTIAMKARNLAAIRRQNGLGL